MGIFGFYLSQRLLRKVIAGTWKQELRQKPWKKLVYWFAFQGLLSLLSYTTQDQCPSVGYIHSDLGTPSSRINEENTWQTRLCTRIMKAFSSIEGISSEVTVACVNFINYQPGQQAMQKTHGLMMLYIYDKSITYYALWTKMNLLCKYSLFHNFCYFIHLE